MSRCLFLLPAFAAAFSFVSPALADWESPRTSRRYLHPPMAERMFVLWNDAKISFAEVLHEKDWSKIKYKDQVGDVCWFFRGPDDSLFDFRKAENIIPADGTPLHGLEWKENKIRIRLEACCDYERACTGFGRFTVINDGKEPYREEYAIRLRHGREMKLLGDNIYRAPDYYSPYDSYPETWKDVPCDWALEGDGGLKSASGGFMTFSPLPPASRWDAEKGELRFVLEVPPGGRAGFDFALGYGKAVRPAYDDVAADTAGRWKSELAKINRLPAAIRENDRWNRIVSNLVVQMLQCFCRPVGRDYVLPRQGGLQRWVWPWDNMEALTALVKVGDYGDYVRGAIDFYFGLYGRGGYPQPEFKGRIGPFGNDWDCNTANVIGILGRYCVDADDPETWRKYRENALEGFRWVMSRRVKEGNVDGLVPGLFPPGQASDYKAKAQTWTFTDMVNILCIGDYLEAAEKFRDPALDEIRRGIDDYVRTVRHLTDVAREKSAGSDMFDVPVTADGKPVPPGYPKAHQCGLIAVGQKYGFIDETDVLRIWRHCVDTGLASPNGLTGNFPNEDLTSCHYWYTTSQDKRWHRIFRKIGRHDLADRILDATLKFAMSREMIVGERYRDDNPWYFPWSPNCSGSGRIIQMLFDAHTAPRKETFEANGCTVRWTDHALEVGNGLFSRRYTVAGNGVLRTVSIRVTNGNEWQGWLPTSAENGTLKVSVEKAKWGPVGVEGLRVSADTKAGRTVIRLFPDVPGVIVERPAQKMPEPMHDLDRDFTGIKKNTDNLLKAASDTDSVTFVPRHIKLTSLLCADQTDIRDNVLYRDERMLMLYDWAYSSGTTMLDCRDVLTGEGLAFVRIAPMPASRPGRVDDFIVDGSGRRVVMLANGYPLVELVYRGGDAGRRRALVAFQRALRPYRPGRDGILLSNTWGAGNRDSRICQDFLLKEIEAGARIGVDVIQIDDGWQRGRTQNSKKRVAAGQKKVWNGYWDADPDFWKEDRERFPDGLDVLVKKAREHGMRFGLWFGPDSSGDAANWERDAACLLDFHRRLGIDYFKMDSMKLHTPLAMKRNRMMFERLLTESEGRMVFDLDCTAEIRPGFMGLIDIGPMFVENRYTRRPVYWPHHTLKNLWDLSHVLDPVRLRCEFNNPDTNHEKYGVSPLGHYRYRPDTLFATVMAASPLAWMELSDVSGKSVAAIAPLVRRWKQERARWHGGVIHPVGSRPDGMAWTGFVSEASDGNGGYALVFRELNGNAAHSFDLAGIFGGDATLSAEVIGGRGKASFDKGVLSVEIPARLDFLWIKMSR